jgi:N-acetyl-1-D-myo-inositol-2-amino-2-deoxy-alpha-D-glucopyranoside deacetylase
MPERERRIVLVHAHPDDECISTGGTIARYSEEGAHVCLITCTNGELGEVADVPELGTVDEIRERLAEVRVRELEEACRRLGAVDLRLFGYHDSGMEGTPSNDEPEAFINQPFDDVVERIVDVLREVRPQVLITYNEYGFYGHPDHVRAHEAATAAVEQAADRGSPRPGAAHRVAKVYHTAIPRSALRQVREMMAHSPIADQDLLNAEEIERIGTDDHRVTTALDVSPYVDHKFRALEAHRTQYGTTRAFLEMPEEFRLPFARTEWYVLASSTAAPPEGIEQDLFEQLEG